MTFRLRALALIMFVATLASGATAWLTLRQASRQVRQSAAADRADVELVTQAIEDYGTMHATWDGVAQPVRSLTGTTGQRIRIVRGGAVLVDSDVLAGRTPRPVVAAGIAVDPRPVLQLPDDVTDDTLLVRLTVLALARYRAGARYAACLTRAGVPVAARPGEFGVPDYAPTAPGETGGCTRAEAPPEDARADTAEARTCLPEGAARIRECLGEAFARQVTAVAPPVVEVYVGALDAVPATVAAGPTVAVAVAVAAAAVLAGLVLSRRVLRPVSALTAAARAVETGDLGRRVPATGRDEIGELGRAFNRMAGSLQESEERQRRLVADVAHELRTPLANLRGYLEALRDGVVEGTPELVASLHEEVLLQQRIVDDLQDLALAEAGRLNYHHTDIDLGDVAEAAVAAHRALADAAGVTLTVERDPAPARGDADRLRQVLANLLTNAVRATPAGGAVTVTARRDDGRAMIEVADTGSGIDDADLPYVFDRFWRADTARGRQTGGSGLGLAIARQIVLDHGGTLGVTCERERGTTFLMTLPST